ncbi:hypothetical protein [Auritidibacter ignavus]|uniref:hypothetical protein n=1 Tax=Auritidibacter ignavus TaxID=678932 RepID=UPI0010A42C68|nr:hypothetical protein [Auritidibacter ignavus]
MTIFPAVEISVTATPIAPLVNTPPVEDAHRNGVDTADVAHEFSSAPTPSQELHWPQTRPDGATQSGVAVQRAGQGESPSKNSQDLSPVVPSTSHAGSPRA